MVAAGSVRTERIGGDPRKKRHREAPRVMAVTVQPAPIQASPSFWRASWGGGGGRLSFSNATQRGTGKKPQSGTADKRATGMYFAQSRSRSATSSALSM